MTSEQAKFFDEVLKELEYAEMKHHGWPDDVVHASAILNEEAGKLTKASLDHAYGMMVEEETLAAMRRRSVSTAAMALRFYGEIALYKYGASY